MSGAGGPDPRRVEALFDALADLEPDDAKRRLADECAGEEALYAAVSRLLEHDRAASSGFLEPPRALLEALLRDREARAGGLLSGIVSDSGLAPPTRLGRYVVLRRLGEGGMGEVYVGYDEALDRRVALKVLRWGAETHRWLLREGQALGRLAHPNVVAVHEVGEQEGRVFLAMELVVGPTLGAWLVERPRPFSEVVGLFLQAGRGLAAVHDAGLVHRDFKPDNVIVGPDGRARVIDLGIASLSSQMEQDGDRPAELPGGSSGSALVGVLTRGGAVMGTPVYMSPEVRRGERATPWSDQWSFCVALHLAAFGAPPPSAFEADHAAPASRTAPRTSVPRRSEVPDWLTPILERGLDPEPSARFRSMAALIGALESHLPRDPELDPTPVALERRILSGFYLLSFLTLSILLLSERGARVLMDPVWLVAAPSMLLVLLVGMVTLRWRRLSANRYGRNLARLMVAGVSALVLHRVVALGAGMTPAQILIDDLVLVAAMFVAVGQVQDPWICWLSAIAAGCAVAGALMPAHVATAFGVAGVLCAVAFTIRLYLDRNIRPESPASDEK